MKKPSHLPVTKQLTNPTARLSTLKKRAVPCAGPGYLRLVMGWGSGLDMGIYDSMSDNQIDTMGSICPH